MNTLTYEEECLLGCFDGISKNEVISDMESKLPYLGEDMSLLAQQTLKKIENMTNKEFDAIRK